MIKIGLTGGIGSGKSVVGTLLQTYDVPVYVADTESKQLIVTSEIIRARLIDLLGSKIYSSQGLNRHLMASLIFNDDDLLKKVNNIIHPEVYIHYLRWLEKQTTKLAVLESAILFESDFYKEMDIIVMVDTPRHQRISRVMARDSVSEHEVMQRMKHQIPEEVKKERSGCIIINDEKKPLIPQIEFFVSSLNGVSEI